MRLVRKVWLISSDKLLDYLNIDRFLIILGVTPLICASFYGNGISMLLALLCNAQLLKVLLYSRHKYDADSRPQNIGVVLEERINFPKNKIWRRHR